uniref:Reverse transcriptase domain-containing protein n=1 Tax=Nicotiana tabacum TaxID=4097 RepID=A0A1S3XZ69_TOBAC|nr:PREDICTED: uncharacterized protein LOC107770233 [Nicotiana tabacum]
MDDSGRLFDQTVEYDWKPEFCGKCLKIDHDCTKARKEEVKQIQQPKRNRPQPVKQVWKKCESTVNYTILIIEETTKPFDAARGLRQGDPISPFLFAIAMEYLSRSLKTLKHVKIFHYHPMCSRLDLTHLSFADDFLLFTRGDTTSVVLLHQKFNPFQKFLGLKANLAKSSIYYEGVSNELKHEIQQALGYIQGVLPFKYLGIPLDTKKLSILQWQPLIDKIVSRISSWTTKKLSYVGRIQIVQTVIFGIQVYWAQIFIIPPKVIKAIEVHCRSYIWSGVNTITKKSLVAWDMMCFPTAAGGLKMINLAMWNKAAITKTCWELDNKKDKLWII